MKLYVEIEKKKGERITTFLSKCYKIDNYNVGFSKTFLDKELTSFHCKDSSNRSVEDIYSVIKAYYPKCSEKNFMKQLSKFLDKNKRLKLLFCPDIEKWVIMYSYNVNDCLGVRYLYNYSNSSLKTNKKGKGKYCYNDIMILMGHDTYKFH
jgi:hypothetical protein